MWLQIHKTHHGPDLGEATTFPFIIYFMHGHETNTQMTFCPRTPKWESQNSQNWDSRYTKQGSNTTLSKGLTMFCANCTMMRFATNLVLIQVTSLLKGPWMNLLLLNPRDNPQFCYWSYNSILINWRPHFCEPLFWAWNPLGELTYLGQYIHLPKVAWGSLSLNVRCCHNWNIWLWKGFMSLTNNYLPIDFFLSLGSLSFPWPHVCLLWPLLPLLGSTWFFWVILLPISPYGHVGASSSMHSTIFIKPWQIFEMSIF
jgi:hypothetical protein